jgi:hypothetical protein
MKRVITVKQARLAERIERKEIERARERALRQARRRKGAEFALLLKAKV